MADSTYAHARYNFFFFILNILYNFNSKCGITYSQLDLLQNVTCIFGKCKLSDGIISKPVQIYYKKDKDSIPYIAIFNVHDPSRPFNFFLFIK